MTNNDDIGSPHVVADSNLKRTARLTGVLYLCFFIAGILGTFVVHSQLFAQDDPVATLSNLTEHATLARLRIVLELGIVLTQALTAVWFYRLFHTVDALASGALTTFAIVNAVAIMGSAALLATALDVSDDASLVVPGGMAATVQLLYVASGHLWGVGAIFFGLWLIPMGRLVLRSGWMPRMLGLLLVAGGISYVASGFVSYAFPSADIVAQLLVVPSIIGEVWTAGYLIIVGVREHPEMMTQAVERRRRPSLEPVP